MCHEIGHLILHTKLLENRIEKREDVDYTLSLNSRVSELNNNNNNIRLEIQANIFASHLLIPINPLIREVTTFFCKRENK
ncbi:ImmA/IrrE family metallo-endopeptidase [Flavobacterium sp. LT1R49]|uniref:ImmA/IrrE family metallo-endopeptidase n=1 Tax=Flavobacterium arabinosi TaxID=3398737 RepID=UPI003A89CA48